MPASIRPPLGKKFINFKIYKSNAILILSSKSSNLTLISRENKNIFYKVIK